MIEKSNLVELTLAPSTKNQKKEYIRWIKHLNLSTKGEKYILLCILNFDWKREKILDNINYIKECKNGESISFYITMRAPSITTDYIVGNPYKEEGWSLNTLNERLWYTYHKMDDYTRKR